jgi:pyruvate kinase
MCINYDNVHDWIRKYTGAPTTTHESVFTSAVKTASDIKPALIILITENGLTARLVAKIQTK